MVKYSFRLILFISIISVVISCSSSITGLTIKPNRLDFDIVNRGDKVSIDVVFKNNYGHLITVSDFQFEGSTDYSYSGNFTVPFDLERKAEQVVTITFEPSTNGPIEATMLITHSGSTKIKLLPLKGEGLPVARMTLSEPSFDYEYRLINSTTDHIFDIKNEGTANLDITNMSFIGTGASAFTITSGGAIPINLAPGFTHSITVQFAPTNTITYACELELAHNAVDQDRPLRIPLSGECVTSAPKIELDRTTPWNFGKVAKTIPSIQPLEISSNGLSKLEVTSIDFAVGSEFSLDRIEDINGIALNLPVEVQVGDKVIAYIKFEPTANTNFTDTMSIYHNGIYSSSPIDFDLSGDGRDEITVKFSYTGAQQQWVIPNDVSALVVECYGAEGSISRWSGIDYNGGKGGLAKATVPVTAGDTVYLYVGGKGIQSTSSATGGWNGGGGTNTSCTYYTGAQGGGASDIRIGGTDLTDRIVVGAGGGGGGLTVTGGDGGGLTGDPGTLGTGIGANPGGGGTQTAGGAEGRIGYSFPGVFGEGGRGKGSNCGGGGGGGGWYGGGGGYSGAGGGGSSYIDAPGNTDKSTTKGVRSGDGEIIIKY